MAVFLWKRKKIKRKKIEELSSPKQKRKMVARSQSSLQQKEHMKKTILCFSTTKKDSVLFCGFIINSTLLIKKPN